MKCPVCTNVDLLLSQRQGVEIDYCPNCRGVWLDRGELDKIIEREPGGSMRYQGEAPRSAPQPQHLQGHEQHSIPDLRYEEHPEHYGRHDERHGRHEEHRYPEDHEDRGHGRGPGKNRKKSFFGELFDFD
jgi:uncharacterized protein